jgi:hypothetical protein
MYYHKYSQFMPLYSQFQTLFSWCLTISLVMVLKPQVLCYAVKQALLFSYQLIGIFSYNIVVRT